MTRFLAHAGTVMGHKSDDFRKVEVDAALIPGDWPGIYVAVLCYLLILIMTLYVISRLFSY
jgi:hypothetical protein